MCQQGLRHVIAVCYIVIPAGASSNLARFDGVSYGYRTSDARSLAELYRRTSDEGFGAEVKRRVYDMQLVDQVTTLEDALLAARQLLSS